MEVKSIKLKDLKANIGQITGLPKNPRLIKDDKYKRLLRSIQDDPEMLDLRELIVYPYEKQYIVIAGNMRLKAMQELRYKEAPCKVLDKDTPVEKLRAYTIKDNISFGEHNFDLLANEWEVEELDTLGLDLPDIGGITDIKENILEEDERESIKISCNESEREDVIDWLNIKFKETAFKNIVIK